MEAIAYLAPVYLLLFVFWGLKNIKYYLLFTGIMAMPFRTTYTVLDVGGYVGWTNGINIALSDISFIALFVYLVIHRKELRGTPSSVVVPVLCFIGACLPSFINSNWLRISFYEVLLITQTAFLYYFVFTYVVETEKDLKTVVLFLILSLLFQSLFAITQYATGWEMDVFRTGRMAEEIIPDEDMVARAVGTIGRPNSLAVYLVPLLFLTLSMLFFSPWYRRLSFVAVVAGSIALLLSGSRGGWIAFLFSFVILIVVMLRRRIITLRTVVGLWISGGLLVFAFLPYVMERVSAEGSTVAALSRIPLLKVAWNMIVDHPLVGIGANTFMAQIHKYTTAFEFHYIWLGLVHNQYLLIFAETGIIGLVAFLWLFRSFFRESYLSSRLDNQLSQVIGLSTALAFLSMAVHMMFDIYSSPLALSMMFIFCGLCSAAIKVGTTGAGRMRAVAYGR
ncbi:MAG: O-Antigen ligase [Syntrophorhabdaceae bacterium PtaU1.Bin034]|jgi:O-antigen ligase|nr:MAG: O-Antigen ligase [Syntrophorhabdaceae bacterium PtaU1.Bin034]